MTVPTLYLPTLPAPDAQLDLTGRPHHYLTRVLRCRPGDRVRLSDGRGGMALAEVCGIDAQAVQVRILHAESSARPARNRLTMVISALKHRGAETLVTEFAELGVDRIVVAPMARSVARLKPDKLPRLERLAKEAARKVGQPVLPEVLLAPTLAAALPTADEGPSWYLWEDAVAGIPAPPPEDLAHLTCVIGPEGGFAPAEIDLLDAHGATPVRLEGPAYRARTAAFAAAVLALHAQGRL